MSRPLTHEEAVAALEAAALDVLGPDEHRSIVAHAAMCDECGPALAALRDTAAMVGRSAPVAAMDPERAASMRSRLLGRGQGERQGVVIDIPADVAPMIAPRWEPSARLSRAAPWLALAAGIGFVIASGLLAYVWRDRVQTHVALRVAEANDSMLIASVDSMRALLATSDQLMQSMNGVRMRVVNLKAGGAQAPVGWMVWDQDRGRWTLVARFLAMPAAGRTYQLWLMSKGAKISAGTFMPDASGQAMMHSDYQLAADALDAVAVTDEPMGGMPSPTGQMILLGNAR